MSSHECCIVGQLDLQNGVTMDQVREAMDSFLESDGTEFDKQVEDGNIDVDCGLLLLHVEFKGYGGSGNNKANQLAESLGRICAGPGWFEVLDLETGDQESAVIPYFIGNDMERRIARVEYGIQQMEPWILPVIGKDKFQIIRDEISSLANAEPSAGKRLAPRL